MFPEFKKTKVHNVELWSKGITNLVINNLRAYNHLETIVFMYNEKTSEEVIMPVNDFMRNGSTKDMLSTMLRVLAKKLAPDCIIFASEVWMKTEKMQEGETREDVDKRISNHGSIAGDPDSEEKLMVIAETPTKVTMNVYEIIKNGEEIEDVKFVHSADQVSGRFAHLFPNKPKFSEN